MVDITPKHIEALAYTSITSASNPRGEHRYMEYVNMDTLVAVLDLEEMRLVGRVKKADEREPNGEASWYYLTVRGRDYLDRLTGYFSRMTKIRMHVKR